MSPRARLVLILGCLLMAAGAWLLWQDSGAQTAAADDAPTSLAAPAASSAPATRAAAREALTGAPPASAPAAATALRVYPAARPLCALAGVVVDEAHMLVADAQVWLSAAHGGCYGGLEIGEDRDDAPSARSDSQGRFVLERVPSGPWWVHARSADDRLRGQVLWPVGEQAGVPVRVMLSTRPQTFLRVLVLEPTGAPAPDTPVELLVLPHREPTVPVDCAPDRAATTGADGRVAFPALPVATLLVRARNRDGRGAAAFVEPQYGDVFPLLRLTLTPPGSLTGRITGADATELAGARVRLSRITRPDGAYSGNAGVHQDAAVVAHAFTFADLIPGDYTVTLAAPSGLRLVVDLQKDPLSSGQSVVPRLVQVRPGVNPSLELPVVRGGGLTGTVRTDTGAPVANARVRATLVPRVVNAPDGFVLFGAHVWRLDGHGDGVDRGHPLSHLGARTDAHGSYQLTGLLPGSYRVEVIAPGLSYDRKEGEAVRDGATTTLVHTLEPAGVLQGADEGTYVGVVRAGETAPRMLAIVPDHGMFTFPGLPAGEYTIAHFPSDGSKQPTVVLEHVRIAAGRTTWVDLRNRGPVSFAGRLVSPEPLPEDTRVALFLRQQTVRPDGTFEFRLLRPFKPWLDPVTLDVTVGGLTWQLPIPQDGIGKATWSGEFVLGQERLEIRTLDADGRPLASTLDLRHAGLKESRVGIGADGARTLRFLQPGEYGISAFAPGALFASQKITVPAQGPLVLRATASGELEVQVLSLSGHPLRGVLVVVGTWQGAEPPPPGNWPGTANVAWSQGYTDDDGRTAMTVATGPTQVRTLWERLPPVPEERRELTVTRGQRHRLEIRVAGER